MNESPRRIVSLVPSWTETLFDLGAGERLVGVTRYCVEPAACLGGVARVGGTKNPRLEEIAALRPDLVLADPEENRPEHIAWLAERFEVFQAMPRTVRDAAAVVRSLGERLDAAPAAAAIVTEIERQLARAAELDRRLARVPVLYLIWWKPRMSVAASTYIHDVLETAGGRNVTADFENRYPALEDDRLAGLGARLVLLPSEPFEFEERHRRELLDGGLLRPGVEALLVDGKDFCWHGSRSARGLARALGVLAPFRLPRH